MFESHFGMKHRPFRSAPDTERYYPASCHEEVLARLLESLRDEQGIAVLSGAAGLGKTLLCHCLLERLERNIATIFLTNSHFTHRAGLLQAILYDLGQPYQGLSEQELRLAVTDQLLSSFADGKYTLLIVDEAQNLTADLFEELRLLSNLEARQGKAVQVLLVGQPPLLALLRHPDLAAFQQRVAVRQILEPLPAQEGMDYLNAQLRAAGVRPEKVITTEALEILAEQTTGIPRLLNQAAHEALRLACKAETNYVDAEAAMEALHILGLSEADAEVESAVAAEPPPAARTPVEAELLRRLFPSKQHV
jgi:type II secretory pathway predicted ATPase ExeA